MMEYILYALIFIAVKPLFKMIYYKIKFGNEVSIFYFPFLGQFAQIIWDGIVNKDVFYSQKRYLLKNPNLKLHMSCDLKGGVHYALIDPLLKKQVYTEHEHYDKMEGTPFSDMIIDQGILFQSGDKWSQGRKLLTKHFDYDALKAMVLRLKGQLQQFQPEDGKVVDIMDYAKKISSLVITKTFFGEDNVEILPLAEEVNQNMNQMLDLLKNPFVLFRCFVFKLNKETTPKYLLTKKEIAYMNRLKSQKQVIDQQLNKRKEQIQNNEQVEDNVLTSLSKGILDKVVTQEEAIHQYFTLLIAGIDSTSHFIKNCCYALGLYPEVQSKLREEILRYIGSFDQLNASNMAEIKYLQNFLDETLRHYTPTVSLFNRVCNKNVQLGQFLFQKGQSFDVNYIIAHFDPTLFADPLKFDVDRWQNMQKNNYIYNPFSAGQRNCIGQHLAQMEVKTILIYLVLNYELSLTSKNLSLGLGFLYGPTEQNFLILNKIKL